MVFTITSGHFIYARIYLTATVIAICGIAGIARAAIATECGGGASVRVVIAVYIVSGFSSGGNRGIIVVCQAVAILVRIGGIADFLGSRVDTGRTVVAVGGVADIP